MLGWFWNRKEDTRHLEMLEKIHATLEESRTDYQAMISTLLSVDAQLKSMQNQQALMIDCLERLNNSYSRTHPWDLV